MMMIRLTSTRMIILVGVNVFEDIDPGVDSPKVKMTLVLNHDPQQPFHLEIRWLQMKSFLVIYHRLHHLRQHHLD